MGLLHSQRGLSAPVYSCLWPRSHFMNRFQGSPLQMASTSTLSHPIHPSSFFLHDLLRSNESGVAGWGWGGISYGERQENIGSE